MKNATDFSFMSKRLWLGVSVLFFFEVWVSVSYLLAGNWVTGSLSSFWVLITVFIAAKLYWFERLDQQQVKEPA
jgi:hypothetical protein